MNIKHLFLAASLSVAVLPISAKVNGGISQETLKNLREQYQPTAAERALHNAIAGQDINKLALNKDAKNGRDTNFSHRVPSKGITNQRSSGRCWLFTGLNMLRAQAMREHNLPMLEFSQVYNFFYDQLEKSNLFLQSVIDSADKPMDDRSVNWLFSHALGDGGTFTGVMDIVTKYGVVPREAMTENFTSESTSRLRQLLTLKLREDALELRKMKADGANEKALEARKTEMLSEVYNVLARTLGNPPTEFTWTRCTPSGKPIETKKYTPQSFYKELLGNDLQNGYVMFMNDPTREYYKVYEINLDRHAYDGHNWAYLNLPMDEIKELAIASIKDSTAMYFSCDVSKFLDRETGTLDLNNFNYGDLLGVNFGMDKKQRIETGSSASSHAMTLVGVDLAEDGTPKKWLIENSWGNGANQGHLIATDEWMDEYLFRLVTEKKYVPAKYLDMIKKEKPIMLPEWDIMF